MRWKDILEAQANQFEHIEEALWWVIRYVSGSLNDPDWDFGEPTHLDINTSMELVSRYVGNARSVNRPLSRYIVLDKKLAKELIKTQMLPAYGNIFQSFTTAGSKEAIEIGREISFDRVGKNQVEVLVQVTPPADIVLFGYDDVKAARKPGTNDLLMQWDDWAHQGEVMVRITQPIACKVQLLK